MQVVTKNLISKAALSEHFINQDVQPDDKQSETQAFNGFYQLQAEQLTAQAPVIWTQIVYYSPLLKRHQEVVSQAKGTAPLSAETIAYLRSSQWLSDFPPVLTLTELTLEFAPSSSASNSVLNPVSNTTSGKHTLRGYLCPIGYRNCQPEYLLVLVSELLSLAQQENLLKCALLLTKYSELYLRFHHQKSETQLLEHIVHRVGHQLRNPLSLIALYAENLRLSTSSSGLQEQASVIRETVQDLVGNLTDLIYCGKGSQLQVVLQDLRGLVAESVQGLSPWIEQKQLNIVYPSTSVLLPIDRLQMKQVVDNLLSNAIHFSPHFGTIKVDWQSFQGEVLIQIIDQGQGLSQNDLQKIFTPFYSRRSGGTGLGLTIAQKVVLDHQGCIWGQNLLEGGACFSFTLPRSTTASNGRRDCPG